MPMFVVAAVLISAERVVVVVCGVMFLFRSDTHLTSDDTTSAAGHVQHKTSSYMRAAIAH